MIDYGKKLLGTKRYEWSHYKDDTPGEEGLTIFSNTFGNNNNAPFYCINNTPLPTIEKIKEQGTVCWGFTNLMLRSAGIELPFKKAHDKYKDSIKGIRFGCGGSDEWIYLFQDKGLEHFDENGKYPKGTLLIRNFDDLTFGHTALLIEDSFKKPLQECNVIHSAGDGLVGHGKTPGVHIEPVKEQQRMFKFKCRPWDVKHEWPQVPIPGFNYYQAVLLPEYYITPETCPTLGNKVAHYSNKYNLKF